MDTTETLITRAEDLRPGDLFLGPIGGLVGLGVGLGQLTLGEGFRTGTLSIRHAGILTEAAKVTADGFWISGPKLAQAMPSGAEVVPFDFADHWTDRCAWVRLPEDYAGQGADAAFIARLMVQEGVGYSFLTYPALAALKLGVAAPGLQRYVDRREARLDPELPSGRTTEAGDRRYPLDLPRRAICSRFVDYAWSATGKEVLEHTRPGVATPGMLADQLSYRPLVTWCRPRSGGKAIPARSWVV